MHFSFIYFVNYIMNLYLLATYIYIYIYLLTQCNPYHLVDLSSRSKHDVMFVYLHHLPMS